MDILPVIDLKNGHVVHAKAGRRDEYRPIESPLSLSSAPQDIAAGLLRLFQFDRFYVADLDAIEGRAPNLAAIAAIVAAAPGVELWIDNGVADIAAAREFLSTHPHTLVIGSESQTSVDLVQELRDEPRVLLSLDFRGDEFQGPLGLLIDPGFWPARLIVMTLARVGATAGPDLVALGRIVARAGNRAIYAAGGVRNGEDIRSLTAAGAAGVLVATALHNGALTQEDLARPTE